MCWSLTGLPIPKTSGSVGHLHRTWPALAARQPVVWPATLFRNSIWILYILFAYFSAHWFWSMQFHADLPHASATWTNFDNLFWMSWMHCTPYEWIPIKWKGNYPLQQPVIRSISSLSASKFGCQACLWERCARSSGNCCPKTCSRIEPWCLSCSCSMAKYMGYGRSGVQGH